MAAPDPEEAVERGQQGGQQQRADQQADGPVGEHVAHRHDPGRPVGERRAAVDVALRGVDRADGAQRRAPERLEPAGADRLAGGGAALARGADGDGRQAGVGDHALLGHGERQRPPDPLGARPAASRPAGLGADRVLDRALEPQRCRLGLERPRHHPRLDRARAGHVAEHDHGVDGVRVGVLGPRARAREPVGGARRGDHHERLVELARAEQARELEHRRGARQLGETWARSCIAVAEHDDPAARQARPHADHRLDVARALARDLERGSLRAVGTPERLRHAVGEPRVAGRPGAAIRERARQLGQRVLERRARAEGPLAVERVGRQRRRNGRRPVGQRERGDEQRHERRDERGPVYPNVEHRARVPLTILVI